MRSIIPPSPPRWKTVFLPGLLLGVLLALIQIVLLKWGPALGIPYFSDSFAFIWCILVLYLAIPLLFAFLMKTKTGQPAIGYHIGRCAGIPCAVLLQATMAGALVFTEVNPPDSLGMAGGALGGGAIVTIFSISLFLNIVGATLATLGAFSGSRLRKRGVSV